MRRRVILSALGALIAADLAFAVPAAQAQAGGIKKAINAIGDASDQRALKKTTDKYDPAFQKYTKRYFGINFDWHAFKAQGMAESNLKPNAKSWVGARGIMQLMPSTFNEINSKNDQLKSIDNPDFNIAAGIAHDKYLWGLYPVADDDEHLRFMFAAYNSGEGTINRARRAAEKAQLNAEMWESVTQIAPKVKPWRYLETLGYVKKIDENRVLLKDH